MKKDYTETQKTLIRKLRRTEHTYHEDAGHAWLKVKREVIRTLGLHEKISGCSYQHLGEMYLEEDMDAITYLKVLFPEGFNTETYRQWHELYVKTINDGDRSRIRDFHNYNYIPAYDGERTR